MDTIRDQFAAGRRHMIDAFVEMSDIARRAGVVNEDSVPDMHGRFFDGNVEIKQAFAKAMLLAEIHNPHPEKEHLMVMTKGGNVSGGEERRTGPTGIPDANPVSVAQGGAGTGGSSNVVTPPRGPDRGGPIQPNSSGPAGDIHEDSTGDNNGAGAGANTSLFDSGFGGPAAQVGEGEGGRGGPSNVNTGYPGGDNASHSITGTDLPTSDGQTSGANVMKGGRGRGR